MVHFAQAVKFPCALHLLILLVLLFLLIQSLNNVKYGSWWPAGCCSMLTLIYLLLANTLSICLGISQIYTRSKEIAIEKFWETNCDRSSRVEAGGRSTWWRCPLQQSLHPSHIAAGPVMWLQQPVPWRQDGIRGALAPHHLWLAPHSCGSAVHVGAEKTLRGITEIFEEKQAHGDEHHWSLMWHYEEKHCVAFPPHHWAFLFIFL